KNLDSYPDEYYKKGVKITSSDLKRSATGNDLNKVKLLNYFENIYVRNEAYSRQSFEGIFLTEDRQILEGSMSNIFYVKNATVFTPPLTQNILPGITRQVVINLCRENNLEVSEREISYSEITKADEIFLTNSVMEIMPVKEIDIYKIESKIPGSVISKLMEYYKKEIEKK
ncbi:MAG TPA: aminotransferase class IV, partial [Candidatus Humimicrobiaceae bacterium]